MTVRLRRHQQPAPSEDGRYALDWAGGSFDIDLFDRRAANTAVQRIGNNFLG